jgi:serine/threonine protein kinase
MATSAAYQFYKPVIEPLDKGAFRQKVSSRAGSDSSSSLRVLSVLESSNNPNNRATAESSSIDSSARRGYERDSSYNATPVVQEYSRQSSTGSSSLHHRNSTGQGQIHGDNPVPIDGEEVMIEEKRKRASGDGYTYHTYRRGRMLGKGGFAKVYLCTALDTNKNYAVKIVPKANLVKPRARQKVRYTNNIRGFLLHR